MAIDPLFAGVAKLALEEGVKFLYEQAREILGAWRTRRRDPAASPPVVIDAPAEVTVGQAQPLPDPPDETTRETLEELRDTAEDIKDGKIGLDDPAALAAIADLRRLVEAALRAPVTFAGEAPRPVEIADIRVVVQTVRGRVVGARTRSGRISGVDVQTGDVEAGGEVIGAEGG